MAKISNRQSLILEYLENNPESRNSKIKSFLESRLNEEFGRVTIVRDLDRLLKQKLVIREGKGRNVTYSMAIKKPLLKFFDIESYFVNNQDQRDAKYPRFNFEIYSNLNELFNQEELKKVNKLNNNYLKRIKKLSPTVIKKEFERLTIDLSWKSSQIEGNTYSLIDTEILIKQNKPAEGHNQEEAIMILNHKKALDHVINNQQKFKRVNFRDIENLHGLLVDQLNVTKGFRKNLIGITGTNYQPLNNQHQIKEAIEKLVKAINQIKSPIEKALISAVMIAYIQPFEDGNKRTSRLLANAVLLANNYCPYRLEVLARRSIKKL